jgi:hypothetical protein
MLFYDRLTNGFNIRENWKTFGCIKVCCCKVVNFSLQSLFFNLFISSFYYSNKRKEYLLSEFSLCLCLSLPPPHTHSLSSLFLSLSSPFFGCSLVFPACGWMLFRSVHVQSIIAHQIKP